MAAAQSSGYAEDGVVEFIIKNPAGPNSPAFTLRASLSSTVLDLKKQLQKEYQGKPHPAAQTVQANSFFNSSATKCGTTYLLADCVRWQGLEG